MSTAFRGHDDLLDLIAKQNETNAVLVLDGGEGD